ncbi:MAG TPA: hypothetical protein PKI74_00775 [Candidatus Cloacimonas acidaminovorans]|nr:hypothetical protein [Candidatus Cloacimonas acidaminovorans]
MPDNVKNENAVNTKKAPKMADFSTRVSLVELIMILMLVGLVFVFYFGMKQLQIDKANEAIAQEKFENIIPTFKNIIEAMETYRKADEFGDYPAFLEELNLGDINTNDFKFEYSADTYTITAITQPAFGKAGIKVIYNLSDKSFTVEDPIPDKKPTIKDEWLPQD